LSLIAADVQDGKIVLIADSQITQSDRMMNRPGFKLFPTPSAVIAMCGSGDFQPFIKEVFTEFPLQDDSEAALFFNIQQLQERAQQQGLTYNDMTNSYMSMIVVTKSCAYTVGGFAILQVEDYEAIGPPAQAYLALRDSGIDHVSAFQIAIKRDMYCSAPIEIATVDYEGFVECLIVDEHGYELSSWGSEIDFPTEPMFANVEESPTFDDSLDEVPVISHHSSDGKPTEVTAAVVV
jgi:hypothetical protein